MSEFGADGEPERGVELTWPCLSLNGIKDKRTSAFESGVSWSRLSFARRLGPGAIGVTGSMRKAAGPALQGDAAVVGNDRRVERKGDRADQGTDIALPAGQRNRGRGGSSAPPQVTDRACVQADPSALSGGRNPLPAGLRGRSSRRRDRRNAARGTGDGEGFGSAMEALHTESCVVPGRSPDQLPMVRRQCCG